MQRVGFYSFVISLCIHILFLYEITSIGFKLPEVNFPEESIILKFVEVPKDIKEEQVKKDVNTIAEKALSAKDKKQQQERKNKAEEISDIKQLPKTGGKIQKVTSMISKESPLKEKRSNRNSVKSVQLTSPSILQKDLPSEDILSLSEVTDSIFSSQELSDLAFEARSHIVAPYVKDVKNRIQKYWLGYLLFKYPDVFLRPSKAVVWFKILKDGSIKGPKVVRYEGDEMFKDICLASVENVAPFPDIPEDIWNEVEEDGGIEIVFTFRYR